MIEHSAATASTADQKTSNKERASKKIEGIDRAILVFGILAVLGIVLYIIELANGLILTGMRNLDSWGLYIMGFMFFVGLGAGCLAVAALPRLAGRALSLKAERIFGWSALCAMLLAGILIVIDLGQPFRMFELIINANLASPLMWDVLAVGLFIVVSIIYLVFLQRTEENRTSTTSMRIVSGIACAAALIVITVDAWIFGLQQGREMWNTALLGPWFVTSALLSGVGFAILTAVVGKKFGREILPEKGRATLFKLLGALACLDLYCFICDLVTSGYGDGAVASMLLIGPLAPLFWLQMICLAVCIAFCFAPKLRAKPFAIAAAILALVAAFLKRAELVIGGFQLPNLILPGPMSEYTITYSDGTLFQAYSGMIYAPSLLECGIFLGAICLGALIFCLGLKYLPTLHKSVTAKLGPMKDQ